MTLLVSACLLGIHCRYDGSTKCNEQVQQLMTQHTLIPVCPEVLGGLSTPRPACEIQQGRVINKEANDVTNAFIKGANEVLRLAKLYKCDTVILKERSPSCGHGKIYDGTFTSTLIDGNGITAALLQEAGIRVLGESEISLIL